MSSKINIKINNIPILAESISYQQNTQKRPLYGINYSNPIDYVPSPVKGQINITYFPEILTEPNYSIISNLKNTFLTGELGALINISDIFITGYLSRWNFSISPMQAIKAQVTYELFNDLTGIFTTQNHIDYLSYNPTNSSGIGNYISTSFYSGASQILGIDILECEYSFENNVIPIYGIGNPYPIKVYASDATENLSIISETQLNNQYSGQELYSFFGVDSLKIGSISNYWNATSDKINFPINDMKINTSKVDININSLLLFTTTFNKSY